MLKNQDIICISSIDWDFIWQGHQEIMSRLAENGNRILFIENTGVRVPGIRDYGRIKKRIKNWLLGVKGIRKERENLYIFSPLAIPFPYFRLVVWFNSKIIMSILEKWIKAVNFNNPIIWTFLPTPLSLSLIDKISHKLLVYYCIDDFSASSVNAKKIRTSEEKLVKDSDLVFVTSRELYNYCSEYSHRVHLFPFGVSFRKFEEAREGSISRPKELSDIKSPVIGYVGGVHKWVDVGLIKQISCDRPDYSFVFVGPIQTNVSILLHLKNVHFLGQQDHERLPSFIKYFDVCTIPYEITEYTKNVYPTKLNEYLAMGKPVVSTELVEVKIFNRSNNNIVYVASSYSEYLSLIDKAVNKSGSEIEQKRIEIAKKNSWDNRITEMGNLIKKAILEKDLDFDWRVNFVRLFRKIRRKSTKLVIVLICAYLTLFYTPLVWYLSKPLKMSEPPVKSDAIVVFAGGAGESGKAGQGYEERVYRAVELYKQGYADKLIFSSGYAYFLEEARVMKAVAVSLGVSEDAIILEDKANSTYKNVLFTKEILDKRKMNSILLVSSPYHMRRAVLVFKKIAKGIKVTPSPVLESVFYAPPDNVGKTITASQIRAITHEYLGILYYWLKGEI